MVENGVVAGGDESGGVGGRTVLVGVKLDLPSRELLTWALVKVAQPGDTVIAVHVLGKEIVDRAGKSSLLSLVKTFDSVLEVYEGFCNLKQVDLKLKLCRGTSVRKILVREAKLCSAAKLILGTARTHHTIRSSKSVAKYCAKRLSKNCWVLAVNNGKIVFQKECSPSTNSHSQGKEEIRPNTLLNVIQRSMTLSKSAKVVSDSDVIPNDEETENLSDYQNLGQALALARQENCSVCGSNNVLPANAHETSSEESSRDDSDEVKCRKSMAIVPRNSLEASTSSITMLVRQLPEVRPGWPLLRRAVFSDRHAPSPRSCSSLRHISVVQWALRLPSRNHTSDHKQIGFECCEDESSRLNASNGAIISVGISSTILSPLPDNNLPDELEGLFEKCSATCRLFKFQELLSATSNFSTENLVGKGGSSRVYKGCLPDGREIAVKILKQSEDVLKEFAMEIKIITTLNHKNVLSLFGFCFEDNNLLLVYDFLSRGSLEENLHANKKDPAVFRWSERYKVAVGVAEALDYIHSDAAQPVIHRDVKSSNILLADDFEPQLSDFGLAKWASASSTHITCTDVAGTFGYLAPEYFTYGKVNDKVDVYGFGVVLLELLSGRKPISSVYPKGQESLIMWAKPILDDGKYSLLLDPSLGDECDVDQMERMAMAAALCVRRDPQARPQIRTVLKLLQGNSDVLQWAREQFKTGALEEDFEAPSHESSRSNLRSHLNLALLDIEDDSLSMGSVEQGVPWEDYLRGRWSRSSSFN